MIPLRQLLSTDWDDDDFDRRWKEAEDHADTVAKISVGIIIAIVVGILLFVIISVVVCVYCVCKKRTFSSGAVVRGGPQVTTYQFQSQPPQPVGMTTYPQYGPPPPGPGPQYPPAQYPPAQYPPYPAAGPPQAYPPTSTAGWGKPDPGAMSPPPYSAPMGYNDTQKASAPPLE